MGLMQPTLGGATARVPTCRHGRTAKTSDPAPDATQARTYGLREGEVAVALPERFDASLYFIGRIRTPWLRREDCPKNGRESEAVCTIELDPRWAAGPQGLETVEPRAGALLDGQGAARPRAAGAAPLWRAARHLRAALAGAAQPDRASRWRGSCASRATRFRSSASIASTTRRSSTSSRISPRPMRSRTPRSAGTPAASVDAPSLRAKQSRIAPSLTLPRFGEG